MLALLVELNCHHQGCASSSSSPLWVGRFLILFGFALGSLLGADAFSASSSPPSSSSAVPRRHPQKQAHEPGSAISSSANNKPTMKMQSISGIRELVDRYDVFLLDMWGVLHDGTDPYPGVLDCLERLVSQHNKHLVVLSNSSKRRDHSVRMLTRLGFDPNHFQPIVTSGEVTWNMMANTNNIINNNNSNPSWLEQYCGADAAKNVFVLGSGDGDVEYCASCGWTVTDVERADLILARGTFTVNSGSTEVHKQRDGPAAYDAAVRQCLARAAERQLPLLVANPDKVRPDAERPPMPGYLGDLYEKELDLWRRNQPTSGDDDPNNSKHINSSKSLIKRVGKPFPDVYDLVLKQYVHENIPKSRVVMVGDALETDVVGGTLAGIDTAWVVLDGIHSPDVRAMEVDDEATTLEESCQRIVEQFNARSEDTYARGQALMPTFVLPHFRW